jgi:hypothetical protein
MASHLDGTISSSPSADLHWAMTSYDRVGRSPSSSQRWRTEDEVFSAALLLAAAAAAAAITLARHLIEASYPMLRSHHG